MKSKNIVTISLLTVTVLCLFCMIGCQGQQDATPQGQQPGVQQPGGQQLGTPGVQAPGMRNQENGDLLDNNQNMNQPGIQMEQGNMQNNEQRARRLETELGKMNEVDKINAVCSGDTAVIAYSPAGASPNMDATKKLIENKVRQIDPTINNVAVSESADIMQKVKKMADDMGNKPINQIDDEIKQLMNQIRPTTNMR